MASAEAPGGPRSVRAPARPVFEWTRGAVVFSLIGVAVGSYFLLLSFREASVTGEPMAYWAVAAAAVPALGGWSAAVLLHEWIHVWTGRVIGRRAERVLYTGRGAMTFFPDEPEGRMLPAIIHLLAYVVTAVLAAGGVAVMTWAVLTDARGGTLICAAVAPATIVNLNGTLTGALPLRRDDGWRTDVWAGVAAWKRSRRS